MNRNWMWVLTLALVGSAGATGAPSGGLTAADEHGAIGARPVGPPAGADATAAAAEEEALDAAAFREALRQVLPLTPEMTRQFNREAQAVRGALHGAPLQLASRSEPVSFTPGSVPPLLRVAARHAGALAFLDATGAPWPIVSAVVGAPALFSVLQPAGAGENPPSHILTVTALEYGGSSNLTVLLAGAPLPVVVALSVVDERPDGLLSLRMDKSGPLAVPPVVAGVGERGASALLMRFLDNDPPSGATRLHYQGEGPGLKAWRYEGRTYLRTRDALAWPAWVSSVRGGDGATSVYELAAADTVILSQAGGRHRYRLTEEGQP